MLRNSLAPDALHVVWRPVAPEALAALAAARAGVAPLAVGDAVDAVGPVCRGGGGLVVDGGGVGGVGVVQVGRAAKTRDNRGCVKRREIILIETSIVLDILELENVIMGEWRFYEKISKSAGSIQRVICCGGRRPMVM